MKNLKLAHKKSTGEYMIMGDQETITNIWCFLRELNRMIAPREEDETSDDDLRYNRLPRHHGMH